MINLRQLKNSLYALLIFLVFVYLLMPKLEASEDDLDILFVAPIIAAISNSNDIPLVDVVPVFFNDGNLVATGTVNKVKYHFDNPEVLWERNGVTAQDAINNRLSSHAPKLKNSTRTQSFKKALANRDVKYLKEFIHPDSISDQSFEEFIGDRKKMEFMLSYKTKEKTEELISLDSSTECNRGLPQSDLRIRAWDDPELGGAFFPNTAAVNMETFQPFSTVAHLTIIYTNGTYGICTGILSSPWSVLTAAHCLSGPGYKARSVQARMGYDNSHWANDKFGALKLVWQTQLTATMAGYNSGLRGELDIGVVSFRPPKV